MLIGTRLDIIFIALKLAEANIGLLQAYINLIKHLYRYLAGILNRGLEFSGMEITLEDM